MASIEIKSENVLQACEITLEEILREISERESRPNPAGTGFAKYHGIKLESDVVRLKKLAEFSNKFEMSISINQDDFALIGEYLTIPEKNVGDPRFPRCNQCGGNHSSTEYCL